MAVYERVLDDMRRGVSLFYILIQPMMRICPSTLANRVLIHDRHQKPSPYNELFNDATNFYGTEEKVAAMKRVTTGNAVDKWESHFERRGLVPETTDWGKLADYLFYIMREPSLFPRAKRVWSEYFNSLTNRTDVGDVFVKRLHFQYELARTHARQREAA